MSLTPEEAAESLAHVEETQRQSRQAYGYVLSAPYFFIWGTVWTAGYLASGLFQDYRDGRAGWIWFGLVLAGIVAQLLTVNFQKGRHYRSGGLRSSSWQARTWRNMAGFGLIFAFTIALFSVMHPHPRQVGAYWPLLFGCIYSGAGLWTGTRYVVAGVVLFVATLIGYFFLGSYFFLWMAVFGGGTLILTGCWMRRA